MEEDWRLRVVMVDGGHGPWSADKLEARALAKDAREKLRDRVAVSRDGGQLFVYAGDAGDATAAEDLLRADLEEHGWHAEVELARWHEIEERWEPAGAPLPRTDEERAAERERLMRREDEESAAGGPLWEVRVELPSRAAARELSDRLTGEGLSPTRRWRYVFLGAPDEDAARELAARIRSEAPPGATADAEETFASVEQSNPFAIFGAGTGDP